MNKESLLPLSGFRDRVGAKKYELCQSLRSLFESYGYVGLETPIIEKQEILLNRYGSDAQKLLYLFEDNGKRKVGLRYDLTLPLARFVSANRNELAFPLKRYEIGTVFRAEKPQKGRYRQITQADVDIVGSTALSVKKELLSIIAEANEQFDLQLICYINDRRITDSLFQELKVEGTQKKKLMILLDKKDKITQEVFNAQLEKTDLSPLQKRDFEIMFLSAEGQGALRDIAQSKLIEEIEELIVAFKGKLNVVLNRALVRGLDYYTGLIIECVSEKDPKYGSVVAGGEYDNLIEELGGGKLPAIGVSFGVDRLVELNNSPETPPLFITNNQSLEGEIRAWAKKLRKASQQVEVYPDSLSDLSTQLKYANKRKLDKVLIAAEDEWKEGQIIEKDLSSGQQRVRKRADYE